MLRDNNMLEETNFHSDLGRSSSLYLKYDFGRGLFSSIVRSMY